MIAIRDNVIVKPLPSDNVSTGGIIVSEAHRAVSDKVEVISVGNGTKKNPMNWKPGDIAFRVHGCGDEVEINGKKHFIVKSDWLIAQLN